MSLCISLSLSLSLYTQTHTLGMFMVKLADGGLTTLTEVLGDFPQSGKKKPE